MKRHFLFSLIWVMLSAICTGTAFADYIGPNPDLRTYTEYTIEQISISGVYVQCVDDTASPARALGQYCDISGSSAPEGMTPPAITSCSSFSGSTKSVKTDTGCEYNTTIGINVLRQAANATANASGVCSGTSGADGWCSGSLSITLTGTEPKPDNSLNGGEISVNGDNQSKRGTQPYQFEVSKEGVQSIDYWVYSTVGDTSEKGNLKAKIDRSAPKASCKTDAAPAYGDWYTGNIVFQAASTDTVSGVYENIFTAGSVTGNDSVTFSQTGKNISVTLTARDYAYNTDEITCAVVSIDNTKPVLDSFMQPESTPYGKGDITFSVEGHDDESGVKKIEIIIDGESQTISGTKGSVSVSFNQTGIHSVLYRITDNVGLVTESSVYSFVVDIDPPNVVISTPVHNGISGLLVSGDTVSGTGSDMGSGFDKLYISFPGDSSFRSSGFTVLKAAPPAESISWSAAADFKVPSGKYNVSAKAVDKVGNESSVVSVEVTVDSDKPKPDYTVQGNLTGSGWYSGAVTVKAASSDGETGVMTESVSLDCSPATNAAEGKSVTLPAGYSGTCSITVTAKDYADNSAEKTVDSAIRIDNTAPSFSGTLPAEGSINGNSVKACINDVSDEHSGPGKGYLRISGNSGEQNLTAEAGSGSSVCFDAAITEDGKYSLYFELEDKAGNKSGEQGPVSIIVDASGPEVHFTSVPVKFKRNETGVTYTGTATDDGSGLDKAGYSADGGSTWENLDIDENGNFTVTVQPFERMTVRISATDIAGNETVIESAPLLKANEVSARISVPSATVANMLIRPAVIDAEGNVIDDFSGIESARAFVYGRGYDHRDIELSAVNNYAFRWDGTFPKDEIRETEDGETIIVEGSVDAPEGWYWLTIEVTDKDGIIQCYNSRIRVGTPEQPVQNTTPEYTLFDISGRVNTADGVSYTVNGIRYMLADFSRVDQSIAAGTAVTGKGRAYAKENVLVIESLEKVEETLIPFSGLVDDLGSDYVIIDGHALAVTADTQFYCEDTRTGDYVSGLYRMENGKMTVSEFGPLSCERNERSRTDTGIVEGN